MGDGDWLMWALTDVMTEQLGFVTNIQETQQNNQQNSYCMEADLNWDGDWLKERGNV